MLSEEYNRLLEWVSTRFPSFQKVGAPALRPGIGNMLEFDSLLGTPHRKYPTVHIAGTNGKGSVSHMIAAGLSACGMKVGLYTSPHLKDFRERMRTVEKGTFRLIPEEAVFDFLTAHKEDMVRLDLSYFEMTTGMALSWFASENVDIAVIETGLGGRLDSTNVITPVLSVITNIGLEHCSYLGSTLEQIAFEKAGIIKPGVPVVVGEDLSETRPVFESCAKQCESEILFAREIRNPLGLSIDNIDLKGDYQKRNLNTVGVAAGVLSGVVGIDISRFAEGVARTSVITGLRGRWELLRHGEGVADVICDTGHNAHGLKWVGEQIDRISCDYDTVHFIIGISGDKDLREILRFLPHNVRYIATQAASSRAMDAVMLANEMTDNGFTCTMIRPVAEAYRQTLARAGSKDLVFIGGSNFVVAEIL